MNDRPGFTYARDLHDAGFALVRLVSGRKRPIAERWNEGDPTWAGISDHLFLVKGNVGILSGFAPRLGRHVLLFDLDRGHFAPGELDAATVARLDAAEALLREIAVGFVDTPTGGARAICVSAEAWATDVYLVSTEPTPGNRRKVIEFYGDDVRLQGVIPPSVLDPRVEKPHVGDDYLHRDYRAVSLDLSTERLGEFDRRVADVLRVFPELRRLPVDAAAQPAEATTNERTFVPDAPADTAEVLLRLESRPGAGKHLRWILDHSHGDDRDWRLCESIAAHLWHVGATPGQIVQLLQCKYWASEQTVEKRVERWKAGRFARRLEKLRTFPEFAAAERVLGLAVWHQNSGNWQEGARDVFWSVDPSGFFILRCPAAARNGMKCVAPVYENARDRSGDLVGRGEQPLVVPVGDPDRTDAGGERWRLARTVCSSAGVFRDPTHVHLVRIPMRLDVGTKVAGASVAGAVAVAIAAARKRVEDDLAPARAKGRGGVYDILIGDSGLVVVVAGDVIPGELPEDYTHVAGLPGMATTIPDMRGRLTKILDVVDTHRPKAASWFRDMLAYDPALRRLHLLAPWGSARRKQNRVKLWEEKTDHREHLCWAGGLTHADGHQYVAGVGEGGPPLIMVGGPRGLSPLEAADAANERYLEGLIGLYPRDDINTFITTAPGLPANVREIWEQVKDRPPPSYARRSRGRSYA